MTKVRDATAYLRDRTIDGMNAGSDLWTLMRDVTLPPELAHPSGAREGAVDRAGDLGGARRVVPLRVDHRALRRAAVGDVAGHRRTGRWHGTPHRAGARPCRSRDGRCRRCTSPTSCSPTRPAILTRSGETCCTRTASGRQRPGELQRSAVARAGDQEHRNRGEPREGRRTCTTPASSSMTSTRPWTGSPR